jgi:hypothetical protein
VSPVKYELGVYIPEDDILGRHKSLDLEIECEWYNWRDTGLSSNASNFALCVSRYRHISVNVPITSRHRHREGGAGLP